VDETWNEPVSIEFRNSFFEAADHEHAPLHLEQI
jgi:hypothetical protein